MTTHPQPRRVPPLFLTAGHCPLLATAALYIRHHTAVTTMPPQTLAGTEHYSCIWYVS